MSPYSTDPAKRLREARAKQDEKADEDRLRKLGRATLDKHLEKISGDHAGTPVSEYLETADTELCVEFLRSSEILVAPGAGAMSIDLKTRRSGGPVWRTPNNYPPHPSDEALFLKTAWRGLGIRIGDLRLEGERTAVMLCSDEDEPTLRCERIPGLFHISYGMGYGLLPDRTLLEHSIVEDAQYRRVDGKNPLVGGTNGLVVVDDLEKLLASHLI